MGKLIIKNISHKYDKTKVLNNISLEIADGELFTLLGPSGCGKTTLLRIIAGFINPTEGSVLLSDRDITNLSPEKRNIGIVFQSYALFSHMNVYQNICYGLKIKKLNKKQIDETARRYLDMVDLYELRDRKISELSGGQQQRIALARSLAIEPKVLLLDEPLSNLDAGLRDKMRYEIHRLQRELKITTVFVTHDQKEALSISDRIAVFNKGLCVQVDTPQKIYNNPIDEFVSNFVGESNQITINGKTELVRPEMIKLYCKPHDNYIKGEIEKIIFNGSIVEYLVKTSCGSLKVKELNNQKYRSTGDEVYVEITR